MDRTQALSICWDYWQKHEGEPLAEAVCMLSAFCKNDRRKNRQLQKRVDDLEAEKEIQVKHYAKGGDLLEQKSFGYRFADARRQVEYWEHQFPKDRITITLNKTESNVR